MKAALDMFGLSFRLSLRPYATTRDEVSKATRDWIDRLVIGQNLCPFAAAPSRSESLRIVESPAKTNEEALETIKSELDLLIPPSDPISPSPIFVTTAPTTTLVVFAEHPEFLEKHENLITFSYEALSIMDSSTSQLVVFHPRAQHNLYSTPNEVDLPTDDPYNFVTRSPYPTIHLLRTVDLIDAAKFMKGDTEKIPNRNMEKLRSRSLDKVRKDWSFSN